MSAGDHLSGAQFRTASEIIATHSPTDRLKGDTDDASIWARKLEASRKPSPLGARPDGTSSLYEGLAKRGPVIGSVAEPVTLQHPEAVAPGERPRVLDGHHRIAAMGELAPETPIPVAFAADMQEMRARRSEQQRAARQQRLAERRGR